MSAKTPTMQNRGPVDTRQTCANVPHGEAGVLTGGAATHKADCLAPSSHPLV